MFCFFRPDVRQLQQLLYYVGGGGRIKCTRGSQFCSWGKDCLSWIGCLLNRFLKQILSLVVFFFRVKKRLNGTALPHAISKSLRSSFRGEIYIFQFPAFNFISFVLPLDISSFCMLHFSYPGAMCLSLLRVSCNTSWYLAFWTTLGLDENLFEFSVWSISTDSQIISSSVNRNFPRIFLIGDCVAWMSLMWYFAVITTGVVQQSNCIALQLNLTFKLVVTLSTLNRANCWHHKLNKLSPKTFSQNALDYKA